MQGGALGNGSSISYGGSTEGRGGRTFDDALESVATEAAPLLAEHGFPATLELAAGSGFCGAFTTFSSLMYESTRLAQDGAYRAATRTLSLNLVLGGAAACLGLLVSGAL